MSRADQLGLVSLLTFSMEYQLHGEHTAWRTHNDWPWGNFMRYIVYCVYCVNITHTLKTGSLKGAKKRLKGKKKRKKNTANLARQFQKGIGACSAIPCFLFKFTHQQTEFQLGPCSHSESSTGPANLTLYEWAMKEIWIQCITSRRKGGGNPVTAIWLCSPPVFLPWFCYQSQTE